MELNTEFIAYGCILFGGPPIAGGMSKAQMEIVQDEVKELV